MEGMRKNPVGVDLSKHEIDSAFIIYVVSMAGTKRKNYKFNTFLLFSSFFLTFQ